MRWLARALVFLRSRFSSISATRMAGVFIISGVAIPICATVFGIDTPALVGSGIGLFVGGI